MLTHSGESQAEEPAVAARGTSLEQMKVVLFALDRAFGAGAHVLVALPESAFPGDESMESIVLLGIGVDDAAIR